MLEILANRRFENFGSDEDGIVERLSESLLTGYSDGETCQCFPEGMPVAGKPGRVWEGEVEVQVVCVLACGNE